MAGIRGPVLTDRLPLTPVSVSLRKNIIVPQKISRLNIIKLKKNMEKKLKVVNTFELNNYIPIYFHHQVLKVKKNIRGGG